MNSDLVSVIVPVYNVEKYVQKCAESLLKQTHENIEVIFVDDGSPDNSGAIIKKIAKTDNRVKIFHQENAGVSSARNSGMKLATGKYIMFVDADDWVDDTYVSVFLELIKEYSCALAMNTKNYTGNNDSETNENYVISAEKAMEWIYSGKLFVGVWNKIFRRDLLTNNAICFCSDIWYGEGMLFNIECLQYVDTVAICEKNLYHQTFNPNSAMRSFNIESNKCGIRSLDVQRKIWKKSTPEIVKAWEYHRFCFNRTIIMGLVRSNIYQEYNEEFKSCVKELRENLHIAIRYEQNIKAKIYWLRLALFPYLTAKQAAEKFYKRVEEEKDKKNI